MSSKSFFVVYDCYIIILTVSLLWEGPLSRAQHVGKMFFALCFGFQKPGYCSTHYRWEGKMRSLTGSDGQESQKLNHSTTLNGYKTSNMARNQNRFSISKCHLPIKRIANFWLWWQVSDRATHVRIASDFALVRCSQTPIWIRGLNLADVISWYLDEANHMPSRNADRFWRRKATTTGFEICKA